MIDMSNPKSPPPRPPLIICRTTLLVMYPFRPQTGLYIMVPGPFLDVSNVL